jgi:hypothetical protein
MSKPTPCVVCANAGANGLLAARRCDGRSEARSGNCSHGCMTVHVHVVGRKTESETDREGKVLAISRILLLSCALRFFLVSATTRASRAAISGACEAGGRAVVLKKTRQATLPRLLAFHCSPWRRNTCLLLHTCCTDLSTRLAAARHVYCGCGEAFLSARTSCKRTGRVVLLLLLLLRLLLRLFLRRLLLFFSSAFLAWNVAFHSYIASIPASFAMTAIAVIDFAELYISQCKSDKI